MQDATGGVFRLTITASVAVHPFVPVAVTIYVPAALTVILAEVCPPGLHENVAPEEAVAVSVTEDEVQPITASGPALTVGAVLFSVTVTSPKHVLPLLAGSVIVKR